MSQRTFLELTHNPFAPPREGFYGGADRKTHLEHLRHLSQWSRRVLVVTGSFGIGKSTLFRELSGSLPNNAKGARISGSMVTAERDVLLAVAQGLGIACDQEAHIEDLIALVNRSVNELSGVHTNVADEGDEAQSEGQEVTKERLCVVLFDDAHMLTHTAVALLMRLVAESSLRVVLFAEPSLVNNLSSAAKKYEVEWFEIRLSGFPVQDVRDYLEWRFAQAQYRGRLPFTDAQVEKIAERSSGNPNVIDFMANELLADLETGQVRELGGRFPRRHAILAVVLAVLLFLVYQLYRQPPLESSEQVATVATPDVADSQQAFDTSNANVEADTQTQTEVVNEETLSLRDSEQSALSPQTEGVDLGIEIVHSTPEPVVGSGPPAEEEAIETGAVSQDAAVNEPVSEVETEAQREAQRQPQGEAETESETEKPEEVRVEIEETSVVPVREVSTPLAGTSQIPSDIKGPSWLRSQDANHYTLQLMTLSRIDGGVALIRRQDEPNEFAMYPLSRDGKTLFVVTYGVFSNRAAAERAGASLTGELREFKPWIRRLANVQDAIAD